MFDKRDLKDIGYVLGAMLSKEAVEKPENLAAQYVDASAQCFKKAFDLKLPGFPDLRIAKGAKVFPGGGGIVFQCQVPGIEPSLYQALKVTRPTLLMEGETANWDFEASVAEYFTHAPLSHQNLVRVYVGRNVEIPVPTNSKRELKLVKCPTMLMEWLSEPTPLAKYICEKAKDHREVVALLAQALEGLKYLHSRRLVHWDIKSDNVLVDNQGVVRIADLGNSRQIQPATSSRSLGVAQTTLWNLPQKLAGNLAESKDAERALLRDIDSSWNQEWLDLWMLGLDLGRLILDTSIPTYSQPPPKKVLQEAAVSEFFRRCFPASDETAQFTLKYLRLIIRRLSHHSSPGPDTFYGSAEDVLNDLNKLEPEFGAAQAVPELLGTPQRVLRIPCWGNVPFTSRLDNLYNSSLIRRLSNHLQLGTIVHVYPGASHRRSEHVAGVMVCAIRYAQALFSDRSSPFWRISIDAVDMNALIVAALVHDVGHTAFGHFLEELSPLFKGRMHEDYIIDVLDEDSDRKSRFQMRHNSIEKDRDELLRAVDGNWCPHGEGASFLKLVAQILRPSGDSLNPALRDRDAVLSRSGSKILKIQILHSIMDGAIDADKMDYLVRDSHHCGVKYGLGIDVERFLQSLTTLTYDSQQRADDHSTASIAVSTKGILPVESLLLARYQMFNAVYWQHTARAETAMLQYLVCEYVSANGTLTSENAAVNRLENLSRSFRDHDDMAALRWFEATIRKDKCLVPSTKAKMLAILKTLVERDDGIYWKVYEREYSSDANDNHYRLLLALVAEQGTSEADRGVLTAALWLRSLRTGFSDILEKQLKMILKKEGHSGAESVAFTPDDFLVDTAPIGKDQADGIFVVDDFKVRGLSEISAISDYISKTFGFWARKLRVFLAPDVAKSLIQEGIALDHVEVACKNTVRDIFHRYSQEAASIDVRKLRGRRRRRKSGSRQVLNSELI